MHSRCCFTSIVAESVGVVSSGHVTKMAVTQFDPQLPKTPCYTQTLRLYLLEIRSYCRLKFYIAGIKNFAFFFAKNSANYLFFSSHPKNDIAITETNFLTHYQLSYLVCYRSYTHSKCCFTPNRWAWSLSVT